MAIYCKIALFTYRINTMTTNKLNNTQIKLLPPDSVSD